MTDLIVAPRGGGKTTAALAMMREWTEADEVRPVMVCRTAEEAGRLYRMTLDEACNPTWAVAEQFVSVAEVMGRRGLLGASSRASKIRVMVDNADLVLEWVLCTRVAAATWTSEMEE